MAKTAKLDTLQMLRGIAAFLVVLDHSLLAVIPYDQAFVPLGGFAATIGRMGVNIFFLISGFIMVHSTRSTKHLRPILRQRDFGWKRLTRLAPLYWIATFIQIGIGSTTGAAFSPVQVATSLLFLPDFGNTDDPRMPPIVGVGWTLNYEALFYVIFGLTLLLPRRTGLITCIAVIVTVTLAGALGTRYVNEEPLHRLMFFYTYKNMLFFAIGIAVALAHRFIPRFLHERALGLAIGLIVSALTLFKVMLFEDGDKTWQAISLLTCTTVVILAVSDERAKIARGYRYLLKIGNASFSTYLFHAMLLRQLTLVAAPLLRAGRAIPFIAVSSLTCLAAGSLIHATIEVPITRLFRRAGTKSQEFAADAGSIPTVV